MSVILALESSCDDTGAAVIKDGKILANIVSGQKVHQSYGGVVPELASRDHHKNFIAVIDMALEKSAVSLKEVDAIAFTQGPGLLGALLVGAGIAKGLSLSLGKPLIAVNHLQAHLLAHFIDDPQPEFPFLCLLVSGGHTQIILLENPLNYQILGQTKDDAAGEAFDKAAKIMGLPYPGGPEVDRLSRNGNDSAFGFPMPKTQGYDYSFSGIKTSLLYLIRDELKKDRLFLANNKADLSASFQAHVVRYLLQKFKKALDAHPDVQHIGIAGGVAANSSLRKAVEALGEKRQKAVHIPAFEYCTDNAAMIAMTAHFQYQQKDFATLDTESLPKITL